MSFEKCSNSLLSWVDASVESDAFDLESLGQIRDALREVLVARHEHFRGYLEKLKAKGFESRPWSVDDEETPFPLDDIAEQGLGVLDPSELLGLATDQHCLEVLRDVVIDGVFANNIHAEWERSIVDSIDQRVKASLGETADSDDTLEAIVARAIDSAPETPTGDVGLPEDTKRTWGRRLSRAAIGVVLAAMLIGMGAFVGRHWYRGGGDDDRAQIDVARATVAWVPTRGSDEEAKLKITSPIAGFATIVCLAQDRRPLVIPVLGGSDIRVPAKQTSEAFSLPGDTTSVVFVVTGTPSGEPVRREFEGRDARRYTPEETDRLSADLVKHLQRKGYRRMAVGSVTSVPTIAD